MRQSGPHSTTAGRIPATRSGRPAPRRVHQIGSRRSTRDTRASAPLRVHPGSRRPHGESARRGPGRFRRARPPRPSVARDFLTGRTGARAIDVRQDPAPRSARYDSGERRPDEVRSGAQGGADDPRGVQPSERRSIPAQRLSAERLDRARSNSEPKTCSPDTVATSLPFFCPK